MTKVNAGLAQLVERQLPKLNVASSNLVPRSISILQDARGQKLPHLDKPGSIKGLEIYNSWGWLVEFTMVVFRKCQLRCEGVVRLSIEIEAVDLSRLKDKYLIQINMSVPT